MTQITKNGWFLVLFYATFACVCAENFSLSVIGLCIMLGLYDDAAKKIASDEADRHAKNYGQDSSED